MERETLIRLYEDSKQRAQCRGCDADIEFYETLRGSRMPMNAGAVPRKSETDPTTWRVIAYFSSADSHFASCPRSADFSRKAR
jgi:hypothetical protein